LACVRLPSSALPGAPLLFIQPRTAALTRAAQAYPPPPSAYPPAPPPPPLHSLPPGNVLLQGSSAPRAAAAAVRAPPGTHVVHVRSCAGDTWVDPTLNEWPENDHRIFVGDLGKEVTDEMLSRAFRQYGSFNKAKAVRNAKTGEPKGFGFVSFADVGDMVRALKEMDGKYIGNRPCKLKKSSWDSRSAGLAAVPAAKLDGKGFKPGHKRKHVATL